MKAACFLAAVVVHALVLFGFRMETPARPLEMSDEPAPVDVDLVEAAPAPPAAAPAAPAEPAPTPEPAELQPTPDMPTLPPEPAPTPDQEAMPAPKSTPAPRHPNPVPRHQEPRHSMPHSAVGTAATLAGAASHGAPTGPLSSRARYLSNPKPDYPEEARQMRQQGVVILSVEAGANGRASDVSVSRGSGFPQLDQAAVRAVRRWIFEPARAAGLPVSSHVEVPVRFSLSQ